MSHASFKVHEMVGRAVAHEWSVPEFQRGFVWKATQVRDLADSLWLDYPVGSILLWDSTSQGTPPQPRSATGYPTPHLWLVDGQQRTTALCILSGKKPYWWPSGPEWDEILERYDIRFDIEANEPPFFVIANATMKAARTHRYVRIRDLLNADPNNSQDQERLQNISRSIKSEGLCSSMDAMEVYTRLSRVQRVRDRDIVAITVGHDLEEVVDIFGRLNSKGTRVRETDIYLGVVAARDSGWVRNEFMPFLEKLENTGFEITPNLLFQTVAAIGTRRARFRDIDDDFWTKSQIEPAWKKTKIAWQRLDDWLSNYGILSLDILPSQTALVPAVALFSKFPDTPYGQAFEWLLQALRYGRFSSASHTAVEEDLREIDKANSPSDALTAMRARIRAIEQFDPSFFIRDYSEGKFGRLLLYLLVFANEATDWCENGRRIAFDGDCLAAGFEPQFHHIFPRKFLRGHVAEESVEALANIAIISGATNIKISAQDPLSYFAKYGIDENMRGQQYADGEVQSMSQRNFLPWLKRRSSRLADAANQFIVDLRRI